MTDLIENTEDEEIRWSSALSLEQLSRNHLLSPCWQNKQINLETESNNYQVGLLIGIVPKYDHQLSIFVRIYELEKNSYLPNNLQLQIIDQNNNIYQQITSTEYDNIIQYKFWGNKGETFELKISLDQNFTVENFII